MARDTTRAKKRDTRHDTTPDTTHDIEPDATRESAAFVVTITEAARRLGLSVRTVQRRLDNGEWQAVTVAGKRCVRLPATELPDDVTPDATHDTTHDIIENSSSALSVNAATLARDTSHDIRHDTTRDSAALMAAIVSHAVAEAKGGPSVQGVACKVLLSLDDCRALTGLSRAILRDAIETKKLKARKIGRAWRIKRTDLDSYINRL